MEADVGFNSYLAAQEEPTTIDKLEFLVALVNHTIYQWIEEAATYKDAILILEKAFIKKKNVLYARHQVISRKQKEGENIMEYLAA